ncbi:MAG: hypothetical protein QY323_01380 [Patescibacteria group bacterium]|nr:MAG: hypothetical protein QY323_01380 [Patescibacteria group bacterium]
MERTTSRETIIEYLPIIKKIQASLEIRLLKHPSLEGSDKLPFYGLWGGHDPVPVIEAWQIIGGWVGEKGVRVENTWPSFHLVKTDSATDWWEVHKLIAKHIRKQDPVEAGREKAIRRDSPIEIALTLEGDLFRGKHKYSLREPRRVSLIRLLSGAGGSFVKTNELQLLVGNASADALRGMIHAINRGARIHLVIKYNVIEGRSRSGYRINPKYKLGRKK